jgi:hypothetical protein
MKQLKKHPKQQRMEDMKIPGSGLKVEKFGETAIIRRDFKKPLVEGKHTIDGICTLVIKNVPPVDHKVTWEGREYLRSINNEHNYWHLLAGLILIGAIIIAAVVIL